MNAEERYALEGEDRTRIIRKGDLDDAESRLRREMTWRVLVGSSIGAAFAGAIGAFASGGAVAPVVETLGRGLSLF
jgi:hypothetical protein